jgi:hypothetical protein
MKVMKIRLLAVGAAVGLAVALAGCGSAQASPAHTVTTLIQDYYSNHIAAAARLTSNPQLAEPSMAHGYQMLAHLLPGHSLTSQIHYTMSCHTSGPTASCQVTFSHPTNFPPLTIPLRKVHGDWVASAAFFTQNVLE